MLGQRGVGAMDPRDERGDIRVVDDEPGESEVVVDTLDRRGVDVTAQELVDLGARNVVGGTAAGLEADPAVAGRHEGARRLQGDRRSRQGEDLVEVRLDLPRAPSQDIKEAHLGLAELALELGELGESELERGVGRQQAMQRVARESRREEEGVHRLDAAQVALWDARDVPGDALQG